MQIIINSLQRLQNVIPSLLKSMDGEIYDVVMYPAQSWYDKYVECSTNPPLSIFSITSPEISKGSNEKYAR